MTRKKESASLLLVTLIVTIAIVGSVSLPNVTAQTNPSPAASSTVTLQNSWVTKSNVYEGALHFHSNGSDGQNTPTQMFAAYLKQGFKFGVLTDHNVVTLVTPPKGILAIPGQEVTACDTSPCPANGSRVHVGAIGITTTITGRHPAQDAINSVTAQHGVAAINHPTLVGYTFSDATLTTLKNYSLVDNVWPNEPFYDKLLTAGNKVWISASDDAHSVSQANRSGTVFVNANSLTQSDILASLRTGNFYAEKHPQSSAQIARISSITTSGSTITVKTPLPSQITWITKGGAVARTTPNTQSDSYTVRGDEGYVRIDVALSSNKYAQAFSQPVFIQGRLQTAFSVASSSTTPLVNAPFTITGALKSGTTPLPLQPVHLERRAYANGAWGGWTNVAGTNAYTDGTGRIRLSQTVSTAGTYQYRGHFPGTSMYQPAWSSAVNETVKKPTTLTITNSTAPRYNVAFTLSGTLKSGTTGLSGLSVHLERKVGAGSWADVSGTTKTTSSGGAIPSVSQTMTTHGSYSYRWHFTGTGTYQAGYSPTKTFTV